MLTELSCKAEIAQFNDASYSDNRYSDNRYSDNHYSDNRFSDNGYSNPNPNPTATFYQIKSIKSNCGFVKRPLKYPSHGHLLQVCTLT